MSAKVEIEQIKNGLFGVKISDRSRFLIRIDERKADQEDDFSEMERENSRIHEIYKGFINSWEYNQVLVRNDFDLEWLKEELEIKDYRKLEDHLLQYCSKNDELLFKLGFKYAWSLFHECSTKEEFEKSDK